MAHDTIIKICGLTSLEHARFALHAGADWIGLNLVAGPRKITMIEARKILEGIDDPSRAVVLLSVQDKTSLDEPIEKLRLLGVRRLQLYGNVTPQVIQRMTQQGFETIKVQPVSDASSLQAAGEFLTDCGTATPSYMLVDTPSNTQLGGTGRRANWPVIAEARRTGQLDDWPPLILAGGLSTENVDEGLHSIVPAGVDVSSGVESSPGQKDPEKVTAFIKVVRRNN